MNTVGPNPLELFLADLKADAMTGSLLSDEFVPIEDRYPLWINARQMFLEYIPERLVFTMLTRDDMGFDWHWMQQLVLICPSTYLDHFHALAVSTSAEVASLYPSDIFACLTGISASVEAARLADSIYVSHEIRRHAYGRAAAMDVVKHRFGITECRKSFQKLGRL